MKETFTKGMARNIYYGGSLFFLLLFFGLTFDTVSQLPERDNRQAINESVTLGKKVWEVNNCIGCHTLLGEGAYFAPELGNVVERYVKLVVRAGSSQEPADAEITEKEVMAAKNLVKAFIKGRPKDGIPGRRSMPQFNLSEEELQGVADFLEYVGGVNTENWPPNIQG
ncbi:MAG: cytochrome c [Pseudomonadota bacterium]|nr:cytochrome c [Pseudomonadota bacterium]